MAIALGEQVYCWRQLE